MDELIQLKPSINRIRKCYAEYLEASNLKGDISTLLRYIDLLHMRIEELKRGPTEAD